jgi:phage major head subunit gpT-like protein
MPVLDHVSAFSVAMRTEFLTALQSLRPTTPAPYEAFTTKVSSTGKSESHGWMSPPPRLAEYIGSRRYSNVDISKYELTNKSFDASFSVGLDDINDIQTPSDGYAQHARAMAQDTIDFPGREVLKKLALGTTHLCFDGSAFFADSHTIGTGDNLMTADNSGNDGVTHKLIMLYHGGPFKPALWQEREVGGLEDNAGTPASKEDKRVKYWVDHRGAAGYGFWWDAIHNTITDTPTMAELDTILGQMFDRFKTFYLEKNDSAEDAMYVHEQTVFSAANCTILSSVRLGDMLEKLLTLDTVVLSGAQTTNVRKGKANLIVSNYIGS